MTQLHPWPNRLKMNLIFEGLTPEAASAFAAVLRKAVTDITTFGHDIYYEHTPKRMALAGRLRADGYTKSAAVVWQHHEDREEVDLLVSGERLHHMYGDMIEDSETIR